MAKKNNVEPDKDLDDDFDDLKTEEIESVYPKIDKKSSEAQKETEETIPESSEVSEEDYEDDLDLDLEPQPEVIDYKYLKLNLYKKNLENDYELEIIGQSHGFLNIFVKYLLNIEGVNIAAYQITNIAPPKIYIRLKKGYKIKEILYKGIESLREEVIKIQNLVRKLM
jgi:DNA-directed RNA polymerase subunit L